MSKASPTRDCVNIQDPVGKTIGSRRVRDAIRYGMGLQETGRQIQQSLGRRLAPRGVFRFRSHEEADAWLTAMAIRAASSSHARPRSTT